MKIAYVMKSDAATISSLTADDNFPLANIKDEFLSVRYKPTAVTGQYIDFDFGADTEIDTFCLSSNLTSSATITVQHDDNSSFTSPTTIAITETGEDIIFETFTSASDRYWRVNFADSTLSEITIGRCVLTSYHSVPSIGLRPVVTKNTTASNRFSNAGQAHGTSGYFYNTYDLTFPDPTKAQREAIETLFETMYNYTPFFADVFEEGEYPPTYCVLDMEAMGFTYQPYDAYSVSILLREAF